MLHAEYDTQAIKNIVNLLDLVGADTSLRKVTTNEQAGPCPKCGGKDRLHVNTAKSCFFCRQCHPEWGDAIEYVQWRDGVTFSEACELLGGDKTALGAPRMSGTDQNRPKSTILKESEAPRNKWQERARAFVAYCEAKLWETPSALEYLRGRGLNDESIRAARLGYNPKEVHDKPESWEQDSTDCSRGVWLPRGWVIPCEVGGVFQYVKIRRPVEDLGPGEKNKYIAVKGSTKAGVVYGLDGLPGHSDTVLCEGEINALILKQTLGDVCGVASIGDAGNMPGVQALAVLASVRRWWLAFDPDKAGKDGVVKMAGLSGRARVLAWPWADRGEKYDIADAYRDGEDLAAWVFAQIGPADPAARCRWFEYYMRPYLEVCELEPGAPAYTIGLALYNAWELLHLDSEALAELAADPFKPAYQYPQTGRAVWEDPDGGETAVQVLAHLGGDLWRVYSLLDGQEYEVHRDRLQMEPATAALRTAASVQSMGKVSESGELEHAAA